MSLTLTTTWPSLPSLRERIAGILIGSLIYGTAVMTLVGWYWAALWVFGLV